MTLVFNREKLYFICLEKEMTILDNLSIKVGKPIYKNGLGICLLSRENAELLEKNNIFIDRKIIRYLDNFYLVEPVNKPKIRKQLYIRFFGLLGKYYEEFIDVERNKENISHLLNLIGCYIPLSKEVRIIDYGCGTGLSKEIANIFGVNIIGFDSCPIMLDIANRNGLMVWNENDLSKQHSNSIDASISSYVFHFRPENKNLQILFKLLKKGGALAVNFHKDIGIEWANQYLTQIGFRIAPLPNIRLNKKHGSYAIYIKQN